MKKSIWKLWMTLTAVPILAAMLLPAPTQGQALPVAGYPAANNVPGAKELPDPNLTYKVIFSVTKAASAPNLVNPGLEGVAKFVNTLAQYGVPLSHRKIVVVIHQAAVPIVENNETFKSRHHGVDNPNIGLIRSLTNAGVKFHVCGQGVLANKIAPKDIQPDIQLDLWALTTMVNLEMHGYARF